MHTFKRQLRKDNQPIEATRSGRLGGNLFRAGQWLVYWLLWAGMVWAAFAQGVTTTTVQGTVYLANGQPAAGTLQISWPSFTTAAGQAIAAGRTMVAIGAEGSVSVNLAPNQGANPGGLFYTVIYNLSDGSVHTEYWTIPVAAQTTIGAVRAQILPAAQATQAVNKAYVDQAIATVQASELTANGGTLTGPLFLSGDPTTPLQAADKHYVDGQFALALPLAGGAATGPLTAVQLGAVYQVDQFPGADIGAKIQACVNNLNSTFGGVCDARNFPGTLTIASNITISTPNAVIDLPCATITTGAQFIVTAGTRNVVVNGCGFQGGSTASGTQGGTVWVYTGSSNAFQIGDMTGASNTPGFFMHDININTATAGANAAGIYFDRAQEVRLDGIYLNGNETTGQTAVILDGTGNYAGGTFIDVYINGFGTGWQLTGDALGNFANASTFVKTHVVCPTNSGTPIVGTIGVNVLEGDGNTWSGGDVESCSTMFHLGPNAVNNTVNGLRNENSTIQYQADSGSKENAVFTGGTLFTGQLIDNGSRNSFWDAFHRTANGMNGDTYASQQDATITNHLRIGIGTGNERGMENEIVTDFGARWEDGYSDAMGTGFQTWAIDDRINNINRLSVGQYLSTMANVVTNIVLNNGGCYSTNAAPTITISGGGGTGATATAVMAANSSLSCDSGAGFQVVSVGVSSGGSGYTTAPTVTFAGANQVTAPNSVAEIVSQGSTNNQTVMNSAGTGAIVLNGSNNAGTGGVVIGSGGATSTAVATISNTGNAQFNGNLTVSGTSQSAGTLNVKNSADTEVDYYLQPGLTATQKGSFTYKDYTGTSQWYMVKDASNNWELNSAPGNIDIFKAYQSTNSGDTYIDTSNSTGHIRFNYETGTGTETDIYSGGSANLDAAFQSPTAIKFPGLAATSGKFCLQIDNSGFLTNTGTACGTGSGSGSTSGIINSGINGQIAVYSSTGTTIAGVSNLPIASGGTGATTAAAALTSLGAQAALPGVVTNGSNGVTVTGSVAAAGVTSNTTTSSDNNVINVMAPPYNATCNLMQYGSGSISLNSAVLTGFGFTSALVGRKIIVWGAGANIGTTANPNYEPLITTVASYQDATQITLSATASATVPNTSNSAGHFEIGTDDTAAIQAAYNAAAANNSASALLIPANQGNSCLTGAIDLSAGGITTYPIPIDGQGSSVSSLTGLPGQDVLQWPDGKKSGVSTYSHLRGLTVYVDGTIDVSCPSQTSCPSTGNSQTSYGRVAGLNGTSTFNGVAPVISGAVCSAGTCTISLSNTMRGTIQAGLPAKFSGFTGSMTPLNGQTLPVLSSPAPTTTSFAIATTSISGTLTDTGTFTGTVAQNPVIAPGAVFFSGGAIVASSDSTFDQLNVLPASGGAFNALAPWMLIGQQVTIPTLSFSTTIKGIVTGSACPSNDQCVLLNNAYTSAQTGFTGNYAAGLAPPWFIGNCGFSMAASDGSTVGGPQMIFDDVNFIATNGTYQFSNHTCGMFFQQPPYRSNFHRITMANTQYGYVEAVPVLDNLSTWTPDTSSYHDFQTNVLLSFVTIAGDQRLINGLEIYGANHPLQMGVMMLPGPENQGGNTAIAQLYQEPWGFNSGENSRYTGNGISLVGSSLLQGGASVGGPYIEWLADNSVVAATQIGGTSAPTPSTAGLQIAGNGNLFGNITLPNVTPNSSGVNDTGVGNIVLSTPNGVPQVPRYVNLNRCPTGQDDFSFLNGFTSTPFTSWCGLTVDYSTATLRGSGAGNVSYVPSTPGDGNPDPGYIFSASSATGGVQITPSGLASAVGAGYMFPASPSINLVVGLKTSTTGTIQFVIRDGTANTTVHTCTYTVATANTFASHGQVGSSDACNFSLAGVPTGDILQFEYALGVLGAQSIGFISLVPNSTLPTALANGSTATTQTTADATTQVATDAFVHNAIASQTGYQLNEWTDGGQRTSPGVSFSANATELYSFILPGSLSASKITYTPSAADVNSSDFYDIGIYNTSGGLVCHLGATPGSTFAPNTDTVTLSFTSACALLGGVRYYLGITASSATATLTSVGNTMMAVFGNAPSSGGGTTGGTLNSSITPPADNWSANATMPQIALHN